MSPKRVPDRPGGASVDTGVPDPVHGTIVGRCFQLKRLDAILAEARAGCPALVEIVGEPGIGKTRLMQEFALRTRARGVPVLFGSGDPAASHENHAMIRTLLESSGAADAEPADGLDRTEQLLRDALRRRGESAGGLVVLLDDLHHSDCASLEQVSRLLRRPPDGLVVVVSYRPRQASRWVAATLASAVGVRRELLQLGSLSPTDVAALLGVSPGAAVERIHALADGNPLYAAAYRAQLHHEPGRAGQVSPDLVDELPVDVARVLQIELAALPADERAVADAVAVLADNFDPSLAPALSGVEPGLCADLLDRLVARDVLRAALAEEPSLRFRHPVVRAAVYRSMRPGKRRAMHAAAAALLHDLGRPPATYADHVASSARPGDVAAVRILLRAARDSDAPPATSVRWLTAARRLLPHQSTDSDLRSAVELAFANALIAAGRLPESRALLQELAREDDRDGTDQARVVLARATAERLFGRPKEAYALLRVALKDGLPDTDPLAALVRAEAALSAALSGASAAAVARSAEARRALAAAPDISREARVGTVAAFVAAYLGGDANAPARLDRAAAIVDTAPDGPPARDLDTLGLLAVTELLQERDRDAVRHFDRALEIAARSGHEPYTPYLLLGRCLAGNRLGQLERAWQDGVDAEGAAQVLGLESLRVLARILRADVLASLVGPTAGRQLAESALTENATRRGDWCGDVSERAVARLRYACDDRTDTMNALLRCCGGAGLSWVAAANRPYWAAQLADMARAFGDQALAARWVDRAERYARPLSLRGQAAHVTMARARLALDAGSPSAVALAGAAVEAFADLGWLVNEANARLLRAGALGATEQWRAAEAELAEVRRIADLTGARVLHQLVVGEQRRIGGRAGRLTATGGPTPDRLALTRREWDIVQLVAAGTSNAEVAERLYVSVKTVEAHLTRIFRKLGVSSRVGLVALVAVQPGSGSAPPGPAAP